MTRHDLRKQRLAAFIHAVWDEGLVDAADDYIAQAYVIHHDPGDPWHGQTLDRAGFKAVCVNRARPFRISALPRKGCLLMATAWR
jgi:hypothetical protein